MRSSRATLRSPVPHAGQTGASASKWRSFTARRHGPIKTVGHPGGMITPVGLGIGATHEGWAVWSPTRAAGLLLISTVGEPLTMLPGPPGTHVGRRHGLVMLPSTAAGCPPLSTFGDVVMRIWSGSPRRGLGGRAGV